MRGSETKFSYNRTAHGCDACLSTIIRAVRSSSTLISSCTEIYPRTLVPRDLCTCVLAHLHRRARDLGAPSISCTKRVASPLKPSSLLETQPTASPLPWPSFTYPNDRLPDQLGPRCCGHSGEKATPRFRMSNPTDRIDPAPT